MFGGRSNTLASMPNFFPDITPTSSSKATPKPKTIDSIIQAESTRGRDEERTKGGSRRSRSDSSSGEETSCSSSSSSSSPPRNGKRDHSPTRDLHNKRPKKDVSLIQTGDEMDDDMEALSKNNLDMRRLTKDRDELQKSFDTHRDKLKELDEVEEKVANQKELLSRVTLMVEENMAQLEKLEAKETTLLLRVEALKKENAELHAKKQEWDAFREKMAISMGFTTTH